MRFDFAISFSNPQRTLARQLANDLVSSGFKVFFDENFEHELLGKDGADYLNNIFFKESHFCIALLSIHYDKGAWTQLERRAVQARAFIDEPDYLIPVLVDGYKPEWLLPTKIYFDLTSRPLEKLVQLLSLKIDESGIGRFSVKHDILLNGDYEYICNVANRSDIVNLSCRHDESNINGIWILKIEKDEITKKWNTNDFLTHFVGGKVYENNIFIVCIPRFPRNKNIWLYNKVNETGHYIAIPIEGEYDQITDAVLTDYKLIFTIEHGESFILDLPDYTIRCFKKEIPWEKEYNGIDIPSSLDIMKDQRIILGVHKNVSIYNSEGKIESQFQFPEIIHSLRMCNEDTLIIIATREYIFCIDFNTHKQIFKHRLSSSFPQNLTCKKNMLIVYSGFGGMNGSVELLNITTGNSYFLLKSEIFEYSYFDAIISEDGNSIFILNEKTEMINDKREHQRFLTILSRPE